MITTSTDPEVVEKLLEAHREYQRSLLHPGYVERFSEACKGMSGMSKEEMLEVADRVYNEWVAEHGSVYRSKAH